MYEILVLYYGEVYYNDIPSLMLVNNLLPKSIIF